MILLALVSGNERAGLDSTAQAQPRRQTPQRRSNLSSFPAPTQAPAHLHRGVAC